MVVVPDGPGPLVPLEPVAGGGRGRDDLDELIDDLLPDVDDRAGWFDAGLLVVGAALLVWGLASGGSTLAVVAGVAALTLGCVLPLRTGWRRVAARRQGRRRSAVLAGGVPVDISSPTTSRLATAYAGLLVAVGGDADGAPAIAAAHGAVLEAATLLGGRVPTSDREREYVDQRTAAIEALAAAFGPTTGDGSPATLVEARDELDEIAGFNAVSRLEELADEIRTRRHGPA